MFPLLLHHSLVGTHQNCNQQPATYYEQCPLCMVQILWCMGIPCLWLYNFSCSNCSTGLILIHTWSVDTYASATTLMQL